MKKSTLFIIESIVVTLFVLWLIWPALQPTTTGYEVTGDDTAEVAAPAATEPTPAPVVAEPTPEPVVVDPTPAPVVPEPTPEPVAAEPTPEPAVSTATVDVQTFDVKAQVTAYKPLVLFINPGDQVTWSNMNGHDSQSIEGMIPEGAESWHSAMGDNYSHTFTVEGVYFYKCTPHWGTGMGGVIVVGNPTNLDAIIASGPKGAAKRLMKKVIKAIAAR